MTKPIAHREFWIESTPYIDDDDLKKYEAYSVRQYDQQIHVIEYLAVQDLLDALESISGCGSCKTCGQISRAVLTKFREGKGR